MTAPSPVVGLLSSLVRVPSESGREEAVRDLPVGLVGDAGSWTKGR